MQALTITAAPATYVQRGLPPGRLQQPWLFDVPKLQNVPCAQASMNADASIKNIRGTPRRRSGIYVASKTVHAATWRKWRDEYGIKIISTWIDEADAGQSACLRDLSARCIEEAKRCERFVLYCDGEEILKGALLECGAALASGIDVYCIGDCPSISKVFEKHPLWHKCNDIPAAFGFRKD